jgi:hypothetical protein
MLNRITFFRSVLCFTAGACACAGTAQWSPSWDLTAGANFTRYSDPLGPYHGARTGRSANGPGFLFGAYHEWKHQRKTGLLLGMLVSYSTSGYYYNGSSGTKGLEFMANGMDIGRRSMHLTTLDAPVMIVWRGLRSLRLELGIMPRLLLRADERWHGERLDGPVPQPLDRRIRREGCLELLETGWCAGALIEGPARIGMGLRYFQGLTNLDRSPGSSASYGRQIQLAVTYRL